LVERLAVLLRAGGRFGTGDGEGEDFEQLRVGHGSALAQDEGADQGAEIVAEGAGLAQAFGYREEVCGRAEGEAIGRQEFMQLFHIESKAGACGGLGE
jgi:hypothetical protein